MCHKSRLVKNKLEAFKGVCHRGAGEVCGTPVIVFIDYYGKIILSWEWVKRACSFQREHLLWSQMGEVGQRPARKRLALGWLLSVQSWMLPGV